MEVTRGISFKLLSLKHVAIYIYIFLFIFTPFIIPSSNIVHVLAAIAYLNLFIKYKQAFFKVLRLKQFRIFLLINFFLILYTIFLGFFTVGDFSNTYYLTSTCVEIFPIGIFISLALLRMKASGSDILNVLLLIGLIQCIFVLASFLSPTFRNLTLTFFPKEGNFDVVFSALGEYRMFGLTRFYTFSMPLFMGFCIIISFVLGVYKSSSFFFLIPIFSFAIITNARVGLLAIPIVIIVVFFARFRQSFIKQILMLTAIIFISAVTISYIKEMSDSSMTYNIWTWLNDGIKEILLFSKGERSGNMELLANTMWIFPEESDLFFGTGFNLFGQFNRSSDIGYVLNLYYGGILFCSLLYIAYFNLLSKYNDQNKIEKVIFISVLILLFTANFKGTVFRPNELIHAVLLLIIFSVTSRYFNTKLRKKKILPGDQTIASLEKG